MAIKVTSRAWTKIRQILHQTTNNIGFVYSASSGGCNGFNFSLHLLDDDTYKTIKSHRFRTVLHDDDAHVYVDPMSEMYLLGTTIDHVKEDYANGQYESKFIFEVDKELLSTCGCGTSFTPTK
jgi:iron-sulfur cluster assembly accessory protein